jgi:hypothetical protein
MRSTEETMLMDTMIANGVSNKMTEQATGLAAPKPVQNKNANCKNKLNTYHNI